MKHSKFNFLWFAVGVLAMIQSLEAQDVLMVPRNNGTYNFYSSYQDSDLHFYLFDDGYYSLDKSPTHTYDHIVNPLNVKFFTSRPYDDNHVEEELVGHPGVGAQNVSRIPIDFRNKVEVRESWNLVNSKSNYYILQFENIDTTGPISGCVEWHFNNTELMVNEGKILDDYGNNWVSQRTLSASEYTNEGFTHKYVWNFSDLQYEEQRFVYIHVDCLQNEMEKVSTLGIMKMNSCQFIPYNPNNDGSDDNVIDSPHFTLASLVRGHPHDPNCIHTDPYALTLLDEQQTVNYKIYFQNEGTTEVVNASVDFTIYSPVHDLSFVASSDNCILNQQNGQKWNIYFEDINLPSINQQPQPPYENTIGWVEVEVCYDLSLFNQNWVFSDAYIYFDNQPAVIATHQMYRLIDQSMQSNCAVNGLKVTNTTESFPTKERREITVYPNPCSDHLTVSPSHFKDSYLISVFDSRGVKVYEQTSTRKEQTIEMSGFKTGLYFVKTNINGKVYFNRIIRS
ncbi:MAG: T9SS type A sorting domain-containing protein [Bacteroidota bacterium]